MRPTPCDDRQLYLVIWWDGHCVYALLQLTASRC